MLRIAPRGWSSSGTGTRCRFRTRPRAATRSRQPREERVGHLHEHARAVTGIGFGAGGAAVIEVAQALERHVEECPALAALHVDDETNAAAVVLEARVVEAARDRQVGQICGTLIRASRWRGVVQELRWVDGLW